MRGLVATILCLALSAAVAADSSDARFLEGLRQRRLFALAENYCIERLNASDLSPAGREELTIELSRCYAERALHAEPENQPALWAKAIAVTAEFARREPDSPRLPMVQLQAGLVSLAQAEWRRDQAELAAADPGDMADARKELTAAIDQFKRLDAELSEALIRRNRSPQVRPEELSAEELRWLQQNVRYRWARALINLGQTWPSASPDRADALTQALAWLGPLAQMANDDPLMWQARIDEIAALRLLQNHESAGRRLIDLAAKQPPAEARWQIGREALRLAAAQRQFDRALQIVAQTRKGQGPPPAEWDLAELEAYLAAWRAADAAQDQSEAAEWQGRAEALVRAMEGRHGPYWTRRAHNLLARSVTSGSGAESLAILRRAAEAYFRGGQMDAAVAAYDRARQRAAEQQRAGEAFDLGYTAATIEHQRQNYETAKTRYRELALAIPRHLRAADAHLLAIYDAGQTARARTPVSLEEYTQLIDEHLQTWPKEPTASQASFWLGRVREAERAWQAAIAAYGSVAARHANYSDALAATARCYDHWIAETEAAGKSTAPLIAAATKQFESLVRRAGGQLPERWNPAERDAALAAARFYLRDPQPGAVTAEELLSAALADSANAQAEWKTAAEGLLVCALAAQGDHHRALQVLKRISAGKPQEMLTLVTDLGRIADSVAPAARHDLAQVELQTAELLESQRAELSPEEQRRLDLARAKALLAAGHVSRAVELLRRLANVYARDGEVQETLAMALLAGTDRASLESALAKWREVERGSRAGSQRWYRAKYHLALAHERLGNQAQAAQIINLTKVLHPELGGPELKAKFLELLARCR